MGRLESAQCFENAAEAFDLQAGQATVKRVRHAVVNTKACRRHIVIRRKGGLIEAVVSESSFVDPVGTGNVSPVQAHYLGARVDLSQPLRLQLQRIVHRSGIVAEEICAAQCVALIDAVIDLPNCVIGAYGVWKASYYGCPIRTVVRREPVSIAGDGRAQRAARHFQARCANRNTACLQIGDCVRDAIGAIAHYEGTVRCAVWRRQRNHRRTVHLKGIPDCIALAFIGTEKEKAILENRAAQTCSELLQLAWRLRTAYGVEPVASIEWRVAAESVTGAVQCVRAGLQAHVDDCSGFPSIFCRGVFDEIKFLDGIDGKNRRGITRDASAVDDALS